MKLKLLFIPRYHCDPNDYRPNNPPFFPPLGISTLTSYLKQHGCFVNQDDLDIKTAHFNAKNPDKIKLKIFLDKKRVDKFMKTCEDREYEEQAEKILKLTNLQGFDVVGFSLMPTDNPSTGGVTLALAKLLKEKYDPVILIGGSINGEVEYQLLKTCYIDFRVKGHPGSAIGETNLLNFLNNYGRLDSQKIGGLNYVVGGKYIETDREYTREEMFSITKPDFDGLPIELYRKEMSKNINSIDQRIRLLVLPYFFIRGCPWKCAFCSHSTEDYWIGKDPQLVAEELKEYIQRFKTKYFYFHNCTVNPTYEYANNLTDALIKNDVGAFWTDCANLFPLDEKLIKRFKEAGAVRFVFGFEGASERVLRYIGKNFTVKHAIKILKLCKKNDILTELDMICGFPYENEPDIDKTIRFIYKYKELISACSLNKFWLEGKFMKHPEQYGIETNIQDCETHINWAVRNFNEINGLKWEDKLDQTIKCFDKLQKVINETFKPAPDVHNLFCDFICKTEFNHAPENDVNASLIKRIYNIFQHKQGTNKHVIYSKWKKNL